MHLWLAEKVDKWVNSVNYLSKAAERCPYSAYIGMTKSLHHEWGYIQRIVSGAESYLNPLKEALMDTFLPKMPLFD